MKLRNPNFSVGSTHDLPRLGGHAHIVEHSKSGAQILKVAVNDPNRVFCATFYTPPDSSSGVAHILEHIVLGGSKRFPLKDPFFEMGKSSLYTYLNAYTYPDHTVYPVASQNARDFKNLMRVYLDAVLFPRLERDTFLREAWHLNVDPESNALRYGGIVFNEMKGAFSSPRYHHYTGALQELYPDTPYRFDAGGDPHVIPELTHKTLSQFHARYYHPSNARFFLYGSGELNEELDLMDEYLSEFSAEEPITRNIRQSAKGFPKRVQRWYPLGTGSDPVKSSWVTMHWATPSQTDVGETLFLRALMDILAGNAGAPLRMALEKSELGSEVIAFASGGTARGHLVAGLNGAAPRSVNDIEGLILDTLATLSKKGIPSNCIEASLAGFEFMLKNELNAADRGMRLVSRIMMPWLFGGDPLDFLSLDAAFTKLLAQYQRNSRIFQRAIGRNLLENEHHITLHLAASHSLSDEWKTVEERRLSLIGSNMGEKELGFVKAQQERLALRAATPDTPEALASLPRLPIDALDKQPTTVPSDIASMTPQVMTHDIETNGIAFVQLAFPLTALSRELLPYARLWQTLLFSIGTERLPYDQFTTEIERLTGGLGARANLSAKAGASTYESYFCVNGRALHAKRDEMSSLIAEAMLTPRLDDRDRIYTVLKELRSAIENSIVDGGSQFALRHALGCLRPERAVYHELFGLGFLTFLRTIVSEFESRWDEIRSNLSRARETLFNSSAVRANLASHGEEARSLSETVSALIARLPRSELNTAGWQASYTLQSAGYIIPSQVHFTGMAIDLRAQGFTGDASALVVSKLLWGGLLLDAIRFQGGAYGASAACSVEEGIFLFSSYRDPHLARTLDVFRSSAQWLREHDITDDQRERAIISVIRDLDHPFSVDEKVRAAMDEWFIGRDLAWKERERARVLNTQRADIQAYADLFDHALSQAAVGVLAGESLLTAFHGEHPGVLKEIHSLL